MDTSCLEKNVGSIDRIVRLALAVALWIWPLTTGLSALETAVMAALAGILLVTVITGYCPLYGAMNWSTRKHRSRA